MTNAKSSVPPALNEPVLEYRLRLRRCAVADGMWWTVCGDARRMAKDVDKALHEIVAEEGGRSEEEAAAYVEQLRKDKRYRRDVY